MLLEQELSLKKDGLNYVVLKKPRYLQQRLQTLVHSRPLGYRERHLIATHVGDVGVRVDHAKLLIEIQLSVRTVVNLATTNLNAGFGLHSKVRNKRHHPNVLTTMTMEVRDPTSLSFLCAALPMVI